MKRLAALAALAALVTCATAHAHSASDAYLTLDVARRAHEIVIDARWDIALRDLHFVLGLDDDGDGAITWGEVERHRAEIEALAHARLRASGNGSPCAVERGRPLVATHADGAYASLRFRIACRGDPRRVALDYRLFFDVDPSHRGIVVVRAATSTSTSLLSPANARIEIE